MATARVVIKGDNQLKAPLKEAQNDLSVFGQTADKLGQTLKSAFAIGAVVASIGKLASTCKECFNEFTEAEKKYKQLALAVGNGEEFSKMTQTIQALSRQTLSSKGDIEDMVSQLAAMGKSSTEVEKISTAAVYLSNVTGKDLNTAMQSLLKSTNGTVTGLKNMGLDVADLTKEELASGAAIDLVINKFGEMSKTIADSSTQQSFKNISDTFGDLKQAIGAVVDFSIADFAKSFDEGFNGVFQKITSSIATMGAVIKNFPAVFTSLMDTLWQMVKKTFEWDSLKTIFQVAITNIGLIASAMIKGIFTTIPILMKQLVVGIGNYIAYIGASIYDSIRNAVGDSIADAIDWVANKTPGWLKNLLNMDGGFRDSLRNGSSTASSYKSKADNSFSGIGDVLKTAVTDAINLQTTMAGNVSSAASTIYGPLAEAFSKKVDGIIGEDIKKITAIIDTNGAIKVVDVTPTSTEGGTTEGGALKDILAKVKNFGGKMSEWFKDIGSFTTILGKFKQFASPLLIIAEGFFDTLEPFLSQVLDPLIASFKGVGVLLADLIIPCLKPLGDFILALAATVNWAVDWIRYAIGKATIWTSSDDTKKPSDLNSYYESLTSGMTTGTSSSTSVASSSYAGGNHVTINVYQSGAVVGDGGMRQFAQMLKSEFDNLNYYSIA